MAEEEFGEQRNGLPPGEFQFLEQKLTLSPWVVPPPLECHDGDEVGDGEGDENDEGILSTRNFICGRRGTKVDLIQDHFKFH